MFFAASVTLTSRAMSSGYITRAFRAANNMVGKEPQWRVVQLSKIFSFSTETRKALLVQSPARFNPTDVCKHSLPLHNSYHFLLLQCRVR